MSAEEVKELRRKGVELRKKLIRAHVEVGFLKQLVKEQEAELICLRHDQEIYKRRIETLQRAFKTTGREEVH